MHGWQMFLFFIGICCAGADPPFTGQHMLNTFNYFRCIHGTPPLQWDNCLAASAQDWANQRELAGCDLVHSTSGAGETVAGSQGDTSDVEIVTQWYHRDWDYDGFTLPVNDFTQAIWAATSHVGCAWVNCASNSKDFWVCQFTQPGNLADQASQAANIPKPCRSRAQCENVLQNMDLTQKFASTTAADNALLPNIADPDNYDYSANVCAVDVPSYPTTPQTDLCIQPPLPDASTVTLDNVLTDQMNTCHVSCGQPSTTVQISCSNGNWNSFCACGTCLVCDMGTYLANEQTCQDCSIGKFANQSGSTACYDCSLGKIASGISKAKTEAEGCTTCGNGKFANTTGLTTCYGCPAGKFGIGVVGGTSEAQACAACPPGSAQPLAGQTQCTDCRAGFISSTPGQLFCSGCVPGKFQPAANGNACSVCPLGKYAQLANAQSCDNCPSGKYSDQAGATTCKAATIPTIQLLGPIKSGANYYLATNVGVNVLLKPTNSAAVTGKINLTITRGATVLYSQSPTLPNGGIFELKTLNPQTYYGPLRITVKYLGASQYVATTKFWDTTFFTAPPVGIHIINNKFVAGQKVTFFGTAAQWKASNGFATFTFSGWSTVAPSTAGVDCGKATKKFIIKPGTSFRTVYPFMGVFTTNSITKQGSNWLTPIIQMAILDTRATSGNAAGQGKVIAKFCYNPVGPV